MWGANSTPKQSNSYLFNILFIKIIAGLAAINTSAFSIDTIFPELEPAGSSWTVGAWSNSGGSAPSQPGFTSGGSGTHKRRSELAKSGCRGGWINGSWWCQGLLENTRNWSHSCFSSRNQSSNPTALSQPLDNPHLRTLVLFWEDTNNIRVAQRKRGGPITHRSLDRNQALIPC